MPSACVAFRCSNHASKVECREKGISFHRFPVNNKNLLAIWLLKIKRKNFTPNVHSKLCSEHFKDDDFLEDTGNRRMIKPGAIPSKFNYDDETSGSIQLGMPYYCSANGCKNNSSSLACQEKNITFHTFPLKNQVLLKFWLIQMKRTDLIPNGSSWICSQHFSENCFYYTDSGRRMLQSDAVPTRFDFEENEEESQSPLSTIPTVLRVCKRKKFANEDEVDPYEELPSKQLLYSSCGRDAAAQTAISGVSTHLQISVNSFTRPIDLNSRNDRKRDAQVQTKMDGISALLLENTSLQNELVLLKNQVHRLTVCIETVPDDLMMKSLTGFSIQLFKAIASLLNSGTQMNIYANLTSLDQIFVLIVYLRTGISQVFLSILFKTSQGSMSRILNQTAHFIYRKLKSLDMWPSREHINRKTNPVFFRSYPNCRVVLEVVEFPIQRPTCTKTQRLTFSMKKNTYTIKGLVGKTPFGAVCFVSDIWPGSLSERELFLKSGILDLLEEDDLVVADRSFDIRPELEERGCYLTSPKFLTDKIFFTAEELEIYPGSTHHRVHYDNAAGKYNKFKFFEGQSQISSMTFDLVNEYFYIVGFLINFGNPLLSIKQH